MGNGQDTHSPLGTQVAKLILSGQIGEARDLARNRTSWSVPEARAIAGACRAARQRWGARVSLFEFMGAEPATARIYR